MNAPRFASALSTSTDAAQAIRSALDELDAGLDGARPDLVAAFATHHYGDALEALGPRIARATGSPAVFGCTAESIIGGSREVQGSAGLSLFAAVLPETRVRFFAARAFDEDGAPTFDAFPRVGDPERASCLMVADPYSFPIDPYLAALEERAPGVPVVGGMASGALGPGQTLLFTAEGVREAGAVGVLLEGGVELRPVVSQGCRPVGKPWVITACERNLVQRLGGRPALEVFMETWSDLSPADQELMQRAPFVGLAIDGRKERFHRGDFLVRGVMGLHQRDRAIAVADYPRRGQTVQLLVRDAGSAGEDLRFLMHQQGGGPTEPVEPTPSGAPPAESPTESPAGSAPGPPPGALLFSCNGRGARMFEEPDHDVTRVREGLHSEASVAGFFAAGEIGPVGGRNFLHGFTASVAVFRPRGG